MAGSNIPRMVRIASALVLSLVLPPLISAEAGSPKAVTPAEADSHVVERTEPMVPPLAKLARVGGKVKLHIAISPSADATFPL